MQAENRLAVPAALSERYVNDPFKHRSDIVIHNCKRQQSGW
jgi:hypothetical protein